MYVSETRDEIISTKCTVFLISTDLQTFTAQTYYIVTVSVSVSTAAATIMSGTGNNTVTGAATLTALEELKEYFE